MHDTRRSAGPIYSGVLQACRDNSVKRSDGKRCVAIPISVKYFLGISNGFACKEYVNITKTCTGCCPK